MHSTPSKRSLRRANLARYTETIVELLIKACGWSAIVCVLTIFVFILFHAFPSLKEISLWKFFTSTEWSPSHGQYGAFALIVGNLLVAIVAMVIAVPLGLGAAVYISEFATGKTREWLKIGIELLAAIPSIVWGFIGLTVLSPIMVHQAGAEMGTNLLNGGIILALMSVPLIVSISEDALRAVPDSFREAGLALGANKWEMVSRVLFPAARNGLLAACMLGVGRAVGETMAVLLATGNTNQIPHSLLDPIKTLTATIASEMGEASRGSLHFSVLFLIGVLLLLITCTINVVADLIIKGTKAKANA